MKKRKRKLEGPRDALKLSGVYTFSTLGVKSAVHRVRIWKRIEGEIREAGRAHASRKVIDRLRRRRKQNPTTEIRGELRKQGIKTTIQSITRALKGLDKCGEPLLQAWKDLSLAGFWEHKRRGQFVATKKWTSVKGELRRLGFDTEKPCLGYVRAEESEISGNSALEEQLVRIAGEDARLADRLKEVARHLYVKQNPQLGPIVRKAVDYVIDGWDYTPAALHAGLPASMVGEFRSLLRGASTWRLMGRIQFSSSGKTSPQYVSMKIVGEPVLTEEEGRLLMRSLPPSNWRGRLAFGFYWRDGRKMPHPEESKFIATVYECFDAYRDIKTVMSLTGFSRDELYTMFGNQDTPMIVGFERWRRTLDEIEAKEPIKKRLERRGPGPNTQASILSALEQLGKDGGSLEQIAQKIGRSRATTYLGLIGLREAGRALDIKNSGFGRRHRSSIWKVV